MISELLAAIEPKKRILILTHNNPDPDAMAAAFGLQQLIHRLVQKKTTISYMGMIGRLENRELVKQCKIDMQQSFSLKFNRFDYVIVVDTQPQAGNVYLPDGTKVNAVIDHHLVKKHLPESPNLLTDIRPTYGSTCTIVAEYYKEVNIKPDINVATAMVFGIITDAIGTGRDSSQNDQNMLGFLFPHISINKFVKIENPPLPRYHFKTLKKAIENAVIIGRVLYCDLGEVRNSDLIAQAADYMVRMREVKYIFVVGRVENTAQFSLRNKSKKRSIGHVAMQITENIGHGGGHIKSAGGQVPIGCKTYAEIVEIMQSRLLKCLGVAENTEEKLI